MTDYVLDSNIISHALHSRTSPVFERLKQVMTPENLVIGCPVVWYEVRRGLLAKDATSKMGYFEAMFATFAWQDFTPADWNVAATLWVQRRAQGIPIDDADLLIGVFARNRNAVLASDNEKDFVNLGIVVENWTKLN